MADGSSAAPGSTSILSINGGSSSIRFAVYRAGGPLARLLHGKIGRIGLPGTRIVFHDPAGDPEGPSEAELPRGTPAAAFLCEWLEKRVGFASLRAAGHRLVHGMDRTEPALVTPELVDELLRIQPFDPEHLPGELELIRTFREHAPDLPQVACFDTAFHSAMPRTAKLLAIPRRYDAMGIRRYGFHGLSYAYLMEELARSAGREIARGRVILAHLGNGASLAAVLDGRSIDTSMGFTPAGGVPMGTRPGDLDPGVASHLLRTAKGGSRAFHDMIHFESGLLGVSETSSDMHDLLEREASDVRAAEAVALFCYQVKKWIGAFAAALGGVDTLVFSGGIGENAPAVRERICDGLEFLGIELDGKRNAAGDGVISTEGGRTAVRVIRTDEERMIARIVCRVVGLALEEGGSP